MRGCFSLHLHSLYDTGAHSTYDIATCIHVFKYSFTLIYVLLQLSQYITDTIIVDREIACLVRVFQQFHNQKLAIFHHD